MDLFTYIYFSLSLSHSKTKPVEYLLLRTAINVEKHVGKHFARGHRREIESSSQKIHYTMTNIPYLYVYMQTRTSLFIKLACRKMEVEKEPGKKEKIKRGKDL